MSITDINVQSAAMKTSGPTGDNRIRAAIIGASGYVGGEALRLLLDHPNVEVIQATSESNVGKYVYALHPNLRMKTDLKFTSMNALQDVDVLFIGLPHGLSSKHMEKFMAKSTKIIDKGSDYRLKNPADYVTYYGEPHNNPDMLKKFVYGIPELHRAEMKDANYVAAAGCNSTATILGLYPLYKEGFVDPMRTVVEVKAGSSQGGSTPSDASHHPERRDCLRSYAPTGHRHVAEILQELSTPQNPHPHVHFSATSVEIVRGILATSHTFLNQKMENKDVWKLYRKYYGEEPFIRLVKEAAGIYRYPEPKILAGTNYCDIGFELDETPGSNRLVIMSAIDNLMKGSAGQAVQCMNIMMGFDEKAGLGFAGLHPC